jgi:predicted metal-dependent hydrolase
MDPGSPYVLILGVLGAGLAAMSYKKTTHEMAYIESTVDNQKYVVRNLPDKQEAANKLARTRAKLLRLMRDLKQANPEKPIVKQILRNFDASPDRFSESTPDASYTSYSVNKGEKVYMCLRQRNDHEELVDENIITFVALHEMAHIGTPEIGHTPLFWNNFGWLLRRAEEIQIYQYTNFSSHPVEYCGIYITDQPTYNKEKDPDAEK